jgi:hypothetical protein
MHAPTGRRSKVVISAETASPASPRMEGFDARETIIQIVEEVRGLTTRLDNILTDCKPGESVEDRRARMSIALIFVAGFIGKTISDNHKNWFVELANHLTDLNVGTTPEFLRASKQDNRTTDSTAVWVQRAPIAALVFKLGRKTLRNGRPCWKEAARQVASKYPEISQLRGKKAGEDLGTSVYNWFHQFSNGLVKNEFAQSVYDEEVNSIKRDFP